MSFNLIVIHIWNTVDNSSKNWFSCEEQPNYEEKCKYLIWLDNWEKRWVVEEWLHYLTYGLL